MEPNKGNNRAYPPIDPTYPTTPSTFPQPVYNQNSGPQAGGIQSQQQRPLLQGQQDTIYRSRSNTPANVQITSLAHQFSSQNLQGAVTNAQYNSREPSPGQRPRTAGPKHDNYPPMPSYAAAPTLTFQTVPERNPDQYGSNANNNRKKCSQLAAGFFKDSDKRARERNERQSEPEQKFHDPDLSLVRKEQLWSTAGRKEGQYLRFLRTREKPENYTTVKIIGKGTFGEVKLVQKKGNGKVYAMKSLVKTEMFEKDQLAHVRSERDILADCDSPWVVKLYTTFQD